MTLCAIDHLNRRFINLKIVEFLVGKEEENEENEFKVTFDNVNHRFFDFIQTTFWVGQEAENEVAVAFQPLKIFF